MHKNHADDHKMFIIRTISGYKFAMSSKLDRICPFVRLDRSLKHSLKAWSLTADETPLRCIGGSLPVVASHRPSIIFLAAMIV